MIQNKEKIMEPELRPEYVKKLQKMMKKEGIVVSSVAELRQRYEG